MPGLAGTSGRRWWREAVVARVRVIRHVPVGGRGLVAVLLLVNVLLGLLPIGFVLATSTVVGRVPDAVEAGTGSPAWDALLRALLLAAALFVGQTLLAPVQTALGELLSRRVDGWLQARLIVTSLRSPGIAPLEDPAALDALDEASQWFKGRTFTPGTACAGMLALVARYLRLAGLIVLLGAVASWPAAAALSLALLVFRTGQRGGQRVFARRYGQWGAELRRSHHLRDAAQGATHAKELRVYGLTGWVSERYAESFGVVQQGVARVRRRVFLLPYLGYTALGLAAAVAVFVSLGVGAARGEVSLTGLALGLQAATAAIAMGGFYAEADLQTSMGMRAWEALDIFESKVLAAEQAGIAARVLPRPRPPASGSAASAASVGSAAVLGGSVRPGASPASGSSSAGSGASAMSGGSTGSGVSGFSDGSADSGSAAGGVGVRLVGVGFRYPGGQPAVLEGLGLVLPSGRCTALVGVNGAGKTTLVKLLTRLYDPTAGRITVDGGDLRDLPVDAWRRQVSVVFQDFVRYELTAAENISCGAAHLPPDRDAVRAAAARAGVLDVLERLPRGLDTVLSRSYQGGAELSGGQWQRVAIARSLYALHAGARLLILDEPTAALDVRAEAAFFDSFVALTRGVTSVLISHRFSSVRRADRIAVLDGGRVVELGGHDELLAAGRHYARLFRLQAERFAAGLTADGEVDERRFALPTGGVEPADGRDRR